MPLNKNNQPNNQILCRFVLQVELQGKKNFRNISGLENKSNFFICFIVA